ncbi:uncharacterized protein [Primulina eburnea]|uniref:uncharacterized protein n=1 Tax=Primulina eburnea TaxID=1245227 RepID=UPI003C6C4591
MAKGGQASNNQAAARVSVEDSSSPFYLHNGDHPGLNLVSHALTGMNYNTWNRAMSMALIDKNKLGLVDGSFSRPPTDDLMYGSWLRCNSMVISWILNSANREIADSLLYFPTAHETWIDLRDRFQQSNAPRIFQIKKLLNGLQQGSMDVSTYYTCKRTLWDELKEFQPVSVCKSGATKDWINYHNQECSLQFPMGLNESYAQNRAQILMMDPLPIISKIFSLFMQEERQRSIHTDVFSSPMNKSFTPFHSPHIASVKGTFGGKDERGNKIDNRPVCSQCNIPGHTMDKCYKIHGYPPKHPRHKTKQIDTKMHVNQVRGATCLPEKVVNHAGDALSPEHCKQLIAFLSSQLQIGCGSSSDSQQHENCEASVSCFSGTFPSCLNLLSNIHTHWVSDTGASHHICCSLSMYHTSTPVSSKVTLPDSSNTPATHIGSVHLSPDFILEDVLTKGRMIGTGKRVGNLYVLDPSSLSPTQKRLPFFSNNSIRDASFDLVHIDTWGPFYPLSVERYKYFLTIVDDHSLFTWIHLLKRKSDVLTIFPDFYKLVSTQFGTKIKAVRSDNAHEFNFAEFFRLEETNETYISRDVIFHESVFSFESQSLPNNDFFCDNVLPTQLEPIPSSAHGKHIPSTRSGRHSLQPSHLRDYHCFTINSPIPSSTDYPLKNVFHDHRLSSSYRAFFNNISTIIEHQSYSQAVVSLEWRQAMLDELQALECNGTWTIVSLPPGKSVVGCKWVYKAKFLADGTLERYKSRLVAKCYTQQEGIDYFETFSPVAKLVTVQSLLALAAVHGWHLMQLDVINAFLHGDLSEEVYMSLPPGYQIKGESLPSHVVCKLHKSLYGLKQASRQWYTKFSSTLLRIVIATNDEAEARALKILLNDQFKLKDLGDLKYFLGIEVARSKRGIYICQCHYALQLLTDTGLLGCKPRTTPMDVNVAPCLETRPQGVPQSLVIPHKRIMSL